MTLGARKVCLVGDFFVGKTSTARRFHSNTFSEQYIATVGVSVNARDIALDATRSLRLVLWDLASMDTLSPLNINYLRSAAGIVLVADATRKPTLAHALELKRQIDAQLGVLPCVMLINKIDLLPEREIDAQAIAEVEALGLPCFETSAKTGRGIDPAFTRLAAAMLAQ